MRNFVIYNPIIRPGGGPSGYVHNMLTSVQSVGLENKFTFIGKKFHTRDAVDPNMWPLSLRVEIFLGARGVYSFFSNEIRRLLSASKRADAVVIHGAVHPRLILNVRRAAKKLIFMPHSPSIMADEFIMDYCSKGRKVPKRRFDYFLWAERLSISYSDILVFPSEGATQAYKKAYHDIMLTKPIEYIPSGVDFSVENEELEKVSGSEDGKIRVLFVGRYNIHKGYHLFCEVAETLASEKAEFLSAGGGALKATKSVNDLGWRSDIANVILGADIVVVPNTVAYYDLLPLETASLGRPIVFTPAGGSIDQQKELPDSIIAEKISAEALASALKQAISTKEKNPRWGARNRDAYLNKFTASKMMSRWDSFLTQV